MMPPFNRRELSDMAIANSDAREIAKARVEAAYVELEKAVKEHLDELDRPRRIIRRACLPPRLRWREVYISIALGIATYAAITLGTYGYAWLLDVALGPIP